MIFYESLSGVTPVSKPTGTPIDASWPSADAPERWTADMVRAMPDLRGLNADKDAADFAPRDIRVSRNRGKVPFIVMFVRPGGTELEHLWDYPGPIADRLNAAGMPVPEGMAKKRE